MSDTHEPLAAIIAKMRHRADNYRLDGWESVAEELEELCDRIDAAAAREREIARDLGRIDRESDNMARAADALEKAFAPGNAAALRDVLKKIADCVWNKWRHTKEEKEAYRLATEALSAPPEPPSNAAAMREALEEQLRYWNAHVRTRDEEEMRKRTEAALAAPARNCDVGTAEEQSERFIEFCKGHFCDNCPNKGAKRCGIGWSQMPFAPAEGKEADRD